MKSKHTLIPIGVTNGHNLQGFENYLRQLGRAEKTVLEYRRSSEQYFAYLDSKLELSTSTAWLEWSVSSQQKRLTGYALRAYGEFLKEFYPELNREFGVPSRLPAATRPDPKPLDKPDEVVRKLSQTAKQILPKDSYLSIRVFIAVLRELAARRSEAAGIGWNDLSWGKMFVVIRGKGSKKRELPISKKLQKMFAVLRSRSAVCPWLGANKQVLNAKGLADIFKKVAKAAGFLNLKCHTFRATRLTEIGNSKNFNPLLYQAFSGHSDLATAKYYVKADIERMREMVQSPNF